jgi:hemoglobin-like flavoprotein
MDESSLNTQQSGVEIAYINHSLQLLLIHNQMYPQVPSQVKELFSTFSYTNQEKTRQASLAAATVLMFLVP